MKKKLVLALPVKRAMKKLGQDIKEARIRRRITMALMSQRANITAVTLAKIEQGDPSVAFGTYATVIFILGMIDKIYNLMDLATDHIGKALMEEQLPKRVRFAKSPTGAR